MSDDERTMKVTVQDTVTHEPLVGATVTFPPAQDVVNVPPVAPVKRTCLMCEVTDKGWPKTHKDCGGVMHKHLMNFNLGVTVKGRFGSTPTEGRSIEYTCEKCKLRKVTQEDYSDE